MSDSVDAKKVVRAKLFTNGRSQAVRLPKAFRFEGKEVRVRHALGVLEPVEVSESKPLRSVADLYARFSSEDADPIFPEAEGSQ